MHICYRLAHRSNLTTNSICQTLKVTTSSVSARTKLELSFIHKINISFVKFCSKVDDSVASSEEYVSLEHYVGHMGVKYVLFQLVI
jgi:hypothetical protein